MCIFFREFKFYLCFLKELVEVKRRYRYAKKEFP